MRKYAFFYNPLVELPTHSPFLLQIFQASREQAPPSHLTYKTHVRIYCTPSPLKYALTTKTRLEVELLCRVV